MVVSFRDHAPNVAVTIIILLTISIVVFPLRVYTRLKHKAWGSDDWSMLIAVVPFLALSVFCLGSAFQGVGVHKESLDAHHTEVAMMWFFFFEIFFCLSIIPVKLSIAFMLMRVAGPKRIYHYCLWTISTIFILMNLISFFYIIFRCDPISFAWDTTLPGGGHCLPTEDLADIYYADTAVNIITDWCCALLPIPLLWNLHLNTNSKLSVAFLLSLGILASLSACIRLKYTVNLNNNDDYLFSVGDVMIWGYAENGVGFIVGCISTLRPLVRKVFHLGGGHESLNNRDINNNNNYGGRRIGSGGGGGGGGGDPGRKGGKGRDCKLAMGSRRYPHHPAYGGGGGDDMYYLGDEAQQQQQQRGKTETAVTSSRAQKTEESRKGSSSSIERGSEEYILLQDLRGNDKEDMGRNLGREMVGDMGGIQVSRSVHQRRD